MAAVTDVRRARRAGARHLQRLPGAARGRPAARRDAAQPRSEVSLRARLRAGRADRHAVHRACRARARCCSIPIAHGEGNYFAEPEVLQRARVERQCASSATATPTASVTDAANPNGSRNSIAGICNEARNVVGLMPHPERACERRSAAPTARDVRVGDVTPLARPGRSADRRERSQHEPHRFMPVLERHGLKPRRVRAHRRARSAASRR